MSIASLVMDLFSSCWTDPAIGQGGPHHRQALSVDLHAAGLEVQVQGLVKVRTLRKAVLLLHEVTHGEVPVGGGSLGQKHRVVEAKKFVASDTNSYFSAGPDLGSILFRMRAQDMMAPPFSMGLWGLSAIKWLLFKVFITPDLLTVPVQTYRIEVASTWFFSFIQ